MQKWSEHHSQETEHSNKERGAVTTCYIHKVPQDIGCGQTNTTPYLAFLEFDAAKIGEFDVPTPVQQYIATLDVAVDDVSLVEVEEAVQ